LVLSELTDGGDGVLEPRIGHVRDRTAFPSNTPAGFVLLELRSGEMDHRLSQTVSLVDLDRRLASGERPMSSVQRAGHGGQCGYEGRVGVRHRDPVIVQAGALGLGPRGHIEVVEHLEMIG
jgi:hypothetical protein